MDDAIRKALEMAADKLDARGFEAYPAHFQRRAAAAIAAFHDDMAARLIEPWASWHRDMAAAVRRAAGGG